MHKNNLIFRDELKNEMDELIKNVPILYKYAPFEGGKKLLTNSTLLVRNPTRFNDPYDCHADLITYNEIPDSYIKYLVNKAFPHYTRSERRKEALKSIQTKKDGLIEVCKKETIKDKRKRGVTCFSEDCNNLLMWSMYADSHKGICIGFNLEKLYRGLINNNYKEKSILKVNYVKDFKPANYFEDNFKAVTYWLKTKSEVWKYEKEIRLLLAPIKSPKIDEFISFSKDIVSEIYLGSKMDEEHETEIINLVKTSYPHAKLYKMELSPTSFELLNTPIEY